MLGWRAAATCGRPSGGTLGSSVPALAGVYGHSCSCAVLGGISGARCKGEHAEPLKGKSVAAHVAGSDDSFQGVLLKSD